MWTESIHMHETRWTRYRNVAGKWEEKKVELNVEEGKSEGKADAVLECDGTITRKHDVIPISRTNQARRVIALILSIICSNN